MWKFLRTLRGRFLFTLIITGILPFTVVGFVLLNTQSRTLRELSARELANVANNTSQELDIFLRESLLDARAIAALPDIMSMEPARQAPTLQSLHKLYGRYAQFGIANPHTGQLLLTMPPMTLLSIAHLPSYQDAAKGKQQWVIAKALTGDKQILHIHTPIFDANQQVIGVLGSPVPLPNLATILKVHRVGAGNVFLLDPTGKIFVQANAEVLDAKLNYLQYFGLTTAQQTTVSYNLSGYKRIAGVATIPNWGWTVVVDRAETDVLAPAYTSLRLALGGLSISILLSSLAAALLANSLTRPVRRLAVAARALGEGNSLVALPSASSDDEEMATFVQAFDRMRHAVVERETAIRKHVSAIEAVSDGIAILNAQLQLKYVNDAYVKLHGYPNAPAMLNRSLLQLHPDAVHQPLVAEILPLVQRKGSWRGELQSLSNSGAEFTAEVVFTQLENGELVSVVRDITERKDAERALQQTQKLESLGLLAGGIAHDFNNLLTAISGNAALAQMQTSPDSSLHKHIDIIIKSAGRAADLTRQLLAYAGKGQFAVGPLDLLTLIHENDMVLATVLPKRATLQLDLPTTLPTITADRGQIQQVLMNLVINAAEALGPNGGNVLVRAYPALIRVDENTSSYIGGEAVAPGNYVCLEVKDNGVGMTAETLNQIFDPFFTTKTYGRGLGLSATLGIIRTHHGGIQVCSKPGEGSTFRVLFPANPPAVTSIPDSPMLTPLLSHTGTALVIDDEESIRSVIQQILEEFGIDVLLAANGLEGLALFKAHQPAIKFILLDVRMPIMDGEETYQHIRALDSHVAIIFASGYTESGLLNPESDPRLTFLQKPYQMDRFIIKISEIMATSPTVAQ
jgi:PAS domain S-box-containing protein